MHWEVLMRTKIAACFLGMAIVTGFALKGGNAGASPDRDYYTVIDLGTFGGNMSSASSVNEIGWVTGYADRTGD